MPKQLNGIAITVPPGALLIECPAEVRKEGGADLLIYKRRIITAGQMPEGGGLKPFFFVLMNNDSGAFRVSTLEEALRFVDSNPLPGEGESGVLA